MTVPFLRGVTAENVIPPITGQLLLSPGLLKITDIPLLATLTGVACVNSVGLSRTLQAMSMAANVELATRHIALRTDGPRSQVQYVGQRPGVASSMRC